MVLRDYLDFFLKFRTTSILLSYIREFVIEFQMKVGMYSSFSKNYLIQSSIVKVLLMAFLI